MPLILVFFLLLSARITNSQNRDSANSDAYTDICVETPRRGVCVQLMRISTLALFTCRTQMARMYSLKVVVRKVRKENESVLILSLRFQCMCVCVLIFYDWIHT